MGTYREDLLTGVYGVDNVVYEVEVQMSNTNKLRMVNPYGAAYPYNESGDFDPDTTYYLTFDISNPNAVLMDPEIQELGLHWGYGAFSVYHRGSAYAGKLEDGVLTFPQNAFYVDMSEYNKGSFYGNVNKMFALALPGSRIKDYSAEVFSEKVTETDNVATLTFKITKGEDVSYARYAFAEEATLDNVISTLRNGGGTTVSSNNEIVALNVTDNGTYYCVLIYDDGSDSGAILTASATYKKTNWRQVRTGTYTYSILFDET